MEFITLCAHCKHPIHTVDQIGQRRKNGTVCVRCYTIKQMVIDPETGNARRRRDRYED